MSFEQQLYQFETLLNMSEGERANIINTGMFNTFIEAYAIVAL